MFEGASAQALLQEVDRSRRIASREVAQDTRGDLGQYLTPTPTAELMARMFESLPKEVNILDAGAGAGALTAALVSELASRANRPRRVNACCYEIDAIMARHLKATLTRCKSSVQKHDIHFQSIIRQGDFIADAVKTIEAWASGTYSGEFDAAILNPPYKKISANGIERELLRRISFEATNMYSAFVLLAIRLLRKGGQIVAIIPRSFCNGPYFRFFRNYLLKELDITRVHVFGSRTASFSEDGVLQENIIFHGIKSSAKRSRILISASESAQSVISCREVAYGDVFRKDGRDHFIHLPTTRDDDAAMKWMSSMPSTLSDLGISVSTGRVVDFRAKSSLRANHEKGCVPLIYACHFDDGVIKWPKVESKKPNAILASEDTASLLVPTGYYTVTKRFSSKEETRRLVAAVYDPTTVGTYSVGFENHLNYYHMNGTGLKNAIALGLSVYLNCTAIDTYFRQFNGHTQVNATDLRSMRYPSMDDLEWLGKQCTKKPRTTATYDQLVHSRFPMSPKIVSRNRL
jgi:adenine-specific DNA-methyltransferase